jgi:flagellar motor protein MotB
MFSIARYQGDNEEQETRSLEVKQERLKKLNEKFNKKRKVDESPTTDSQKKQKPSQKNKKESDSKEEQEHEKQTKEEEEEEEETQQEEIVENINAEETESLEEQEEEEADEEEMDNDMEENQSDDNDEEEEEEEEDAMDIVDDKEVPTLEAFPEMLGAKAEHSKEEIQMLSKMGIPEWMLQPTTISPTSNCGLDKVGLSPHLIQRCQDHGLSYLFAVQMAVIPVFLRRQMLYDTRHVPGDLCISAPTGSGKTLAYVLPIIDILSKRRVTRLRALVVLPTRDLVTQVKETFDAFVKGTNLKVMYTVFNLVYMFYSFVV